MLRVQGADGPSYRKCDWEGADGFHTVMWDLAQQHRYWATADDAV